MWYSNKAKKLLNRNLSIFTKICLVDIGISGGAFSHTIQESGPFPFAAAAADSFCLQLGIN